MNFKEFEDGLQAEIEISEKGPKSWYQEGLGHICSKLPCKNFLENEFQFI